jgi:type I restriction enzyme R subunit
MDRLSPEAQARKLIDQALDDAGWNESPHSVTPEETMTHGRVIPLGRRARRGEQLRADYVLRYNRDFKLLVRVSAEKSYPVLTKSFCCPK